MVKDIIKIEVEGKEFEISRDEARKLLFELGNLFPDISISEISLTTLNPNSTGTYIPQPTTYCAM